MEFALEKDYIEECKQVSISLFKKAIKYILHHPGYACKGNVNWSRNGEPSGNIGYLVHLKNEIPETRLQYNIVKSEKEMDYLIKLESTKLHWGSDRW